MGDGGLMAEAGDTAAAGVQQRVLQAGVCERVVPAVVVANALAQCPVCLLYTSDAADE